MAIIASQVTVTTSPTLIVTSTAIAEEVNIHTESGAIYLGNSNVTSSTGFKVDNQDVVRFRNKESSVYAITASGTATAYVMVTTI